MFTIKMYTFINIVKFLWKPTYSVMLIYRGHEQLKPIYDNVSGTSKKELLQFGHQIYNVFSNIVNSFWKGVIVSVLSYQCVYVFLVCLMCMLVCLYVYVSVYVHIV